MTAGTTSGSIRILLRLEALAVLILALAANWKWGMDWRTFALFFFVPDLSMLGYLAGPRLGCAAYNVAHSYLGGMACVAFGILCAVPALTDAGMLWFAHVGFDRALGYGLKYSTGFRFTHLGLIGQARPA